MPAPLQISSLIRVDALGMPLTSVGWTPEKCADPQKLVSFPLNSVEPDAVQIIARVQEFADAYGKTQCLFNFARCLVKDVTVNNDRRAHYSRVAAFVLDKVVYIPDPRGAEFVRSPIRMIQEFRKDGFSRGDCDDMVLLANSLFNALGFECRVAAVKLPGAQYHNHVVSQVKLAGVWQWFDPCNKENPGQVWTGDIYFSK